RPARGRMVLIRKCPGRQAVISRLQMARTFPWSPLDMNKTERLTRRQLLGVTVTAAAGLSGAAAFAQAPAGAASFPKLDEKDPTAAALKYVHDAKTVDPKKNPNYKPGQHCANCLQVTGKD